MKPDLRIRLALETDIPSINDIFNHYVHDCVCTYQIEPISIETRKDWFAEHGPSHPILVAEKESKVVGWGALSQFSSRCGYKKTVEDSLYVHKDFHGQGIGSQLLEELLRQARGIGHHAVIALIDSAQTGSLALHKKFGFFEVGCLREVGQKFGRYLDVIYLENILSGNNP